MSALGPRVTDYLRGSRFYLLNILLLQKQLVTLPASLRDLGEDQAGADVALWSLLTIVRGILYVFRVVAIAGWRIAQILDLIVHLDLGRPNLIYIYGQLIAQLL